MKLTAYVIDGHDVAIRPAPVERDWMSASRDRFAYRCLPLNIANAHGWEILCAAGFQARWDGGAGREAVTVEMDGGAPAVALGHFGEGVLTFHVPVVFRTAPGYDLWVQGPVNAPKDAIQALSGVVETDWLAASFTMNWRFTRPDATIRFEAGEAYAHVFPIARDALEAARPELKRLSDDPELEERHHAWAASRAGFNADLERPGSPARAAKWQKDYYRGREAGGAAPPEGAAAHRTRLRLAPFREPER